MSVRRQSAAVWKFPWRWLGVSFVEVFRRRKAGNAFVALELHVAAEWNPGYAPARAVPIVEAGDFGAKAHRKRFDGYAERARG